MPFREGRWRNVHTANHRIEHKGYSHTCRCGKLAYRSKAEAKRAMRVAQARYHGAGGHWNVYKCRTNGEAHHYGHLPAVIVTGEKTRGQVYGDG